MRFALPRYLALGVLALAASSLPPLELPQRLDRVFYDLWSRIAPPAAPGDIVLVEIGGSDDLERLAARARREGAALLVTTLAARPSGARPHPPILGPTAIASAQMPILRGTDWTEGGYLWPRPDLGGVIRYERPMLGGHEATPSLAYAAAQRLDFQAVATNKRRDASVLSATRPADRYGRRWLRFFDPASFARARLDDLALGRSVMASKTVIAGASYAPTHASPVGALTDMELLAHSLAGYRTGTAIAANAWLTAAAWLFAGLWIAAGARLGGALRAAMPVVGTLSLGIAAGTAFTAANLWLPIGGPALLTLGTLAYAVHRPLRPTRREVGRSQQTQIEARRLSARGDLVAAWALYRDLPMSNDLLPEIYAIGCSLADRGERRLATDALHRVAQADAHFEKAAERLLTVCAPPDLEVPEHTPPETLGRYEILGPIGRGTTGVVYLGRDPSIKRIVAVKAIHLELEFEAGYLDEARDRFKREAATAGRLAHASILTIYDFGEQDGIAYIAMEFVRGTRLDEYTAPESLLPAELALELTARAADALDYAHRHNVVHRDIKPANIMYDSGTNSLKITDFGIARLMDVSRTRTGVILGTPSYMSPEQLQGENVNGHTDLFALGVTLYELLTGYLPFRGTSMTDLMFVIANEPHIPVTAIRPELPSGMDDVFERALAKEPAGRFTDGASMARALRDACSNFHS